MSHGRKTVRSPSRRYKMCTSKKRYPTSTSAIKHAIGSSKNTGHALRYYRCPYCRGYHLTSRIENNTNQDCDSD